MGDGFSKITLGKVLKTISEEESGLSEGTIEKYSERKFENVNLKRELWTFHFHFLSNFYSNFRIRIAALIYSEEFGFSTMILDIIPVKNSGAFFPNENTYV